MYTVCKGLYQALGVCPNKLYKVTNLLYFIMGEDSHKQPSLKEDYGKYEIK